MGSSIMFYKVVLGHSEHFCLLKPILENVLSEEADISIVTDDGDTLETHKILLIMFSRTLAHIITDNGNVEQGISVPAKSETVINLIKILTEGAVFMKTKDELVAVVSCGNMLGIDLTNLKLENEDMQEDTGNMTKKHINDLAKSKIELETLDENFVCVPEIKVERNVEDLNLITTDTITVSHGFLTNENNPDVNETKIGCSIDSVQYPADVTAGTSYNSAKSVENFPCRKCEKTFHFKNSLTKHVASVHDNAKFHFEICVASYSYKFNLKRHMELEHESKPTKHECKDCSQTFKYKHNLKTHSIKFHNQ